MPKALTLKPRLAMVNTTRQSLPINRNPWQKDGLSPKRITGRALQTRNDRIKLRDRYTCQACKGVFAPQALEIDHITPLAQGGGEEDANCQSLCNGPEGCHAQKSKHEVDGAQHRGVGAGVRSFSKA